MTEDDEGKLPGPINEHDGELLLYDFFKHLTSLSLLALGGLMVIAQAADPKDVKPFLVTAAIVLISGSGIMAFSGSSEIARARYTRTPARKSLQVARIAAPALLALGAGMFLSMFIDSLT
jgi:hypothetical protein